MGGSKSTKRVAPRALSARRKTKGGNLLAEGTKAPEFSLPDEQGQTHKLKQYKGKWVVLYFYPKDDTSGCTKQACGIRDTWPRFVNANAVVLGVSPDSSASHAKFADKYALPFTLLADEAKKVLSAYGVWQEKSMYGRSYMGVVRTTYLIAPDGKIAKRFDRVKPADHAQQVLDVILGN